VQEIQRKFDSGTDLVKMLLSRLPQVVKGLSTFLVPHHRLHAGFGEEESARAQQEPSGQVAAPVGNFHSISQRLGSSADCPPHSFQRREQEVKLDF
jgi:hypothetical protein